MITKQEAIDALRRMETDRNKIFAYITEQPEPPSPPDPRPKGWVVVKVTKCHLRAVDHEDGAGKAVWRSEPKRSWNPKRDRYLIYLNMRVQVYLDGNVPYGIYKGAWRGSGGNHGWEVVPGQVFNGHLVTNNPKLYILCRDVGRL